MRFLTTLFLIFGSTISAYAQSALYKADIVCENDLQGAERYLSEWRMSGGYVLFPSRINFTSAEQWDGITCFRHDNRPSAFTLVEPLAPLRTVSLRDEVLMDASQNPVELQVQLWLVKVVNDKRAKIFKIVPIPKEIADQFGFEFVSF